MERERWTGVKNGAHGRFASGALYANPYENSPCDCKGCLKRRGGDSFALSAPNRRYDAQIPEVPVREAIGSRCSATNHPRVLMPVDGQQGQKRDSASSSEVGGTAASLQDIRSAASSPRRIRGPSATCLPIQEKSLDVLRVHAAIDAHVSLVLSRLPSSKEGDDVLAIDTPITIEVRRAARYR